LVMLVMLMVLVMVSAQEAESPEARRSRFAHPPEALSKPEDLREEHEWPQDIVDTGKRTQLGSYGCVPPVTLEHAGLLTQVVANYT
jgi:hypothetical protein